MTHTTPQMVMPESFNRDMSLTYVYADEAFTSVTDPFRFDQLAPTGAIKSTAADMARYMIAHLQLGAYQGAQILKTETARLMHLQSFTQDPRLRGWAHGFEEYRLENPQVIGHGGVTYHFYSQMALVPEANLGLFVVDNTSTGRELVDSLVETFIDHYFPPSADTSPAPLMNSSTDLRSIAGSYVPTPFSFGTHAKLRNVIMIFKVQPQADGSLLLSSLLGSKRYLEVEPLFFQTENRTRSNYMDYRMDHLSFHLDSDGKAQYMLFDNSGFQKVPWYETLEFSLAFSVIILLLFLSVPVAAIIWRASPRLREQAAKQPRNARLARWLMWLMVALYFLSLFGMFSAFATENAVLFGKAYAYDAGRFLAILVALLVVGVVGFTVLAWRQGFWSLAWRIHYTLVALGAVGVLWWYFDWKVIG